MLFTMPWRSPFKYRMLPGVPWGVGGLGDEKYRQQVPTAVPGFDGATWSSSPSRRDASGPSTATTTPRCAVTVLPSARVMRTDLPSPVFSTFSTFWLSSTHPCGSRLAICSATFPIPPLGRQLEPVASMRITNWNRRLVVPRELSKKMPPKKGLKNVSMMAGEKPSAFSLSSIEVSGAAMMSGMLPIKLLNLTSPTRILSTGLPIG
mmetsp:Transcript_2915/g.7572  ORF Transcript_2915/g.7572 Transcript_2915/m.7572 type:complete len:206 (-) Transcript_2915:819-1436(-)